MSPMLVPTAAMAALAILLLALAYSKGHGQHVSALRAGVKMTVEVLPLLVFAFLVAGAVQVLVPKELLARWVGAEAGLRGILIGTVAGAFAPGGPYVSLPLVAALLRSGASMGTTVAFLTGWSLWAFSRLPMEVGILGWQFTAIRLASTFFFPPIAGLIAQSIASALRM